MFNIRITVGNIDYEKTITTLFPAALQKCRELDDPNVLLQLFLELDQTALPVLLGILNRLSESAKQELLCHFMNSYRIVLSKKFNEFLQKDTWGRNFVFSSMYIMQKDEELELVGEGVQADYHSLLESEEVRSKINETVSDFKGAWGIGKTLGHFAGNALKYAAEVAPETTEKLGLKLMQREDVKEKLLSLAQTALQKRELAMELKALSFEQTDDEVPAEGIISGDVRMSSALERELIKALAGYIKMTVKA